MREVVAVFVAVFKRNVLPMRDAARGRGDCGYPMVGARESLTAGPD